MNKEIDYLKKYYKGNLNDAIKMFNNGLPVQYIVGNVNFYGYDLIVNKDVLIPRRETEELVEEVINKSKYFNNPVIIDVGAGSGAIAITLSSELKTHVYASDISKKALTIAKKNSDLNKTDITFFEGDMLEPYIKNNIKIDILVSNPPYIDPEEKIQDIVYNNEPHTALFAGDHGLSYYENMLSNANKILNKKYLIAFEIGEKQGEAVKNLAFKYLKNVKVEIKKDLSKKDRFVFVYNY